MWRGWDEESPLKSWTWAWQPSGLITLYSVDRKIKKKSHPSQSFPSLTCSSPNLWHICHGFPEHPSDLNVSIQAANLWRIVRNPFKISLPIHPRVEWIWTWSIANSKLIFVRSLMFSNEWEWCLNRNPPCFYQNKYLRSIKLQWYHLSLSVYFVYIIVHLSCTNQGTFIYHVHGMNI